MAETSKLVNLVNNNAALMNNKINEIEVNVHEIINDGNPGVIGTLIQSNSFLNLLINLRDNFY